MGKMDVTSDGRLTIDEILGFAKTARHEMAISRTRESFQDIDEDKDGKISLQELLVDKFGPPDPDDVQPDPDNLKREKVMVEAMFKVADEDGDGFLDEKQLTAVYAP